MTRSAKRVAALYASAFLSDLGRPVLDDLRATYGRRQSFSPDEPGDGMALALRAAFREGQRSVLTMIDTLLEIARTGREPEVPREEEVELNG
jgi:hypothetical protein